MTRFLPALAIMATVWGTATYAAPLEAYFFSFDTCYGRSYTADHMKAHPQQQVVEMALSHHPSQQELLGMDSPFQPYPDTPRMVVELDVWMSGENTFWRESAICEADGDRLQCGFECDGGTFFVEASSEGRLMIKVPGDLYFTQCGAREAVLPKHPEHAAFLLYPMPLSLCSVR